MDLEDKQLEQLKQWNEAKEQLKHWQQVESTLRDSLVCGLFSAKDDGTETLTLQGGWKLKAVKKLNYSLNNKDGQVTALAAALPPELATNLIKWNPDLSVAAYKKLTGEMQAWFNGCLTIKPGKPTLELVAPDE